MAGPCTAGFDTAPAVGPSPAKCGVRITLQIRTLPSCSGIGGRADSPFSCQDSRLPSIPIDRKRLQALEPLPTVLRPSFSGHHVLRASASRASVFLGPSLTPISSLLLEVSLGRQSSHSSCRVRVRAVILEIWRCYLLFSTLLLLHKPIVARYREPTPALTPASVGVKCGQQRSPSKSMTAGPPFQ